MSTIPFYKERLRAMMFQVRFMEKIAEIEPVREIVSDSSDAYMAFFQGP